MGAIAGLNSKVHTTTPCARSNLTIEEASRGRDLTGGSNVQDLEFH